MDTTVIGIDCATKEQKTGIALGEIKAGALRINHVIVCDKASPLQRTLLGWIPENGRVLLALDAPLGWPHTMGVALLEHSAGQRLDVSANLLFRRETDRFVKEVLDQQPLDVGADRIARTALSAVNLLAALREGTNEDIPLAWSAQFPSRVAAIEVYPAATLRARGISSSKYKEKTQVDARRQIIAAVPELSENRSVLTVMETVADALDAALCLIAAADFMAGNAFQPTSRELAEKEGWIWVRTGPALKPKSL